MLHPLTLSSEPDSSAITAPEPVGPPALCLPLPSAGRWTRASEVRSAIFAAVSEPLSLASPVRARPQQLKEASTPTSPSFVDAADSPLSLSLSPWSLHSPAPSQHSPSATGCCYRKRVRSPCASQSESPCSQFIRHPRLCALRPMLSELDPSSRSAPPSPPEASALLPHRSSSRVHKSVSASLLGTPGTASPVSMANACPQPHCDGRPSASSPSLDSPSASPPPARVHMDTPPFLPAPLPLDMDGPTLTLSPACALDFSSDDRRRSWPASSLDTKGGHKPLRLRDGHLSSARRHRTHGLAGSFLESLFSGRLHGEPHALEGFSLVVRVMGKGQLPKPVRIPFAALYYNFNEDDMPAWTCPYVARVPLPSPLSCPSVGTINVMIVNPSNTPIKMLMVKYDLRDQPWSTQTLLRYQLSTKSARVKYAVQLRFARPLRNYSSNKDMAGHEVVGCVRVCFPHISPDDSEDLLTTHTVPEPCLKYAPITADKLPASSSPAVRPSAPRIPVLRKQQSAPFKLDTT